MDLILRFTRLVLISTIFLCSGSAFASNDWIGFKKYSDPAVPSEIRIASKSVFRIFFPGAPFDILDLSNEANLENLITKYSAQRDNWSLIQLAFCRMQEILKCPVSSSSNMGGGSGFIVHDKKTLATNLHNLHPWISRVVEGNANLKHKTRDLIVPILIMDQEGNVVFNPMNALSSRPYQIKVINELPRLFTSTLNLQRLDFALSDYVELEFSKDFAQDPIKFARTSKFKRLYNIGFPGPTSLFSQLGGQDGDGLNQMISTGVETMQNLSSNPNNASLEMKFIGRSNAPAYVGNSGGPALNELGEVIGIVRSGDINHQENGRPAYFSEFIRLSNIESLIKFWETIP